LCLNDFLNDENAAVLECITDKYVNAELVKNLKKWINQEK